MSLGNTVWGLGNNIVQERRLGALQLISYPVSTLRVVTPEEKLEGVLVRDRSRQTRSSRVGTAMLGWQTPRLFDENLSPRPSGAFRAAPRAAKRFATYVERQPHKVEKDLLRPNMSAPQKLQPSRF